MFEEVSPDLKELFVEIKSAMESFDRNKVPSWVCLEKIKEGFDQFAVELGDLNVIEREAIVSMAISKLRTFLMAFRLETQRLVFNRAIDLAHDRHQRDAIVCRFETRCQEIGQQLS